MYIPTMYWALKVHGYTLTSHVPGGTTTRGQRQGSRGLASGGCLGPRPSHGLGGPQGRHGSSSFCLRTSHFIRDVLSVVTPHQVSCRSLPSQRLRSGSHWQTMISRLLSATSARPGPQSSWMSLSVRNVPCNLRQMTPSFLDVACLFRGLWVRAGKSWQGNHDMPTQANFQSAQLWIYKINTEE